MSRSKRLRFEHLESRHLLAANFLHSAVVPHVSGTGTVLQQIQADVAAYVASVQALEQTLAADAVAGNYSALPTDAANLQQGITSGAQTLASEISALLSGSGGSSSSVRV